MTYQRLEPRSILGCVFDQIVRSTVLAHHPKQSTINVSSFKCCVDVSRHYRGMSPVCGGQRWAWVHLFWSYLFLKHWALFLWFPLSVMKCIWTNFILLTFIHTLAMKSHICACRSQCQIITGMLTCLGDNPWSRIWAHLCVRSVCIVCVCVSVCRCISVPSCIMLPLTDHKHNGPT